MYAFILLGWHRRWINVLNIGKVNIDIKILSPLILKFHYSCFSVSHVSKLCKHQFYFFIINNTYFPIAFHIFLSNYYVIPAFGGQGSKPRNLQFSFHAILGVTDTALGKNKWGYGTSTGLHKVFSSWHWHCFSRARALFTRSVLMLQFFTLRHPIYMPNCKLFFWKPINIQSLFLEICAVFINSQNLVHLSNYVTKPW